MTGFNVVLRIRRDPRVVKNAEQLALLKLPKSYSARPLSSRVSRGQASASDS
ncbi:MAG: hypothetical protein QOI96_738 [Verrucomicrobiota bacterium]